jgi:Fe-S cluster biogenesis protein NfuA
MQGILERVEIALQEVRPFLEADKGNVEVVGYNEETRILELRFVGACKTCSMSAMTLRAGIERAIRTHIPEIHRVEAV